MTEDDLTADETAAILGIVSTATKSNWLEQGHFEGAYYDDQGIRRFPISFVRKQKLKMEELQRRNEIGDFSIPYLDDDEEPPAL